AVRGRCGGGVGKWKDSAARGGCPNGGGPPAAGGAHAGHWPQRIAARTTLRLAFKSCLLCPRKRTLELVKLDQDDPPVCRRRCSQYRRTLSSSWNRRPEPRSMTPSFVRS